MLKTFGAGLRAAGFAVAILAAGCSSIDTTPINQTGPVAGQPSPTALPDPQDDGSTIVALAFSGGGSRAAAFAYGALTELDTLIIDDHPVERSLVDDVRSVAGTSGGAVMAAYLGYRGKDGYVDFRERFLEKNGETYMRTTVTPANLVRTAVNGGANDRSTFGRFLDEEVFDGSTYAAFRKPDRPLVWITASDIYNRTPFLFTQDTFSALCSDLDQVKIADAVAASAAFPVAFAPVVIETPARGTCNYKRPDWLQRALDSDNPSVRLHAYARMLDSYQSNSDLKYVRLLDGGLTDNLGIGALSLERAQANTPYAPLSAYQAVRIRNFLFIVTDAGVENPYDWGAAKPPPHLSKILRSVADTTIAASTRSSFDAVDLAFNQWQQQLIEYRCGLSNAQVLRLRGTLAGWNCRDVVVTTEHLTFRDADPSLYPQLNKIPTRLRLDRQQVDLVIQAGREAVRRNANIQRVARETHQRSRLFDAAGPAQLARN
ncbi:patatin-like phospholipase family protein [Kaistia terrae]|uniref:Patatin-like phospholipase family protein n=1 Tax=Kaistia terrae TaxID=537017 RepID=A0ABW0PQR2_9HYPH|nr:patatin-like phospholipase family protein [Kaistia terrae]MCX5577923.1 patatin-like phospholipase family protein [Kaistia terrae]